MKREKLSRFCQYQTKTKIRLSTINSRKSRTAHGQLRQAALTPPYHYIRSLWELGGAGIAPSKLQAVSLVGHDHLHLEVALVGCVPSEA
jgi:hypothetical protein